LVGNFYVLGGNVIAIIFWDASRQASRVINGRTLIIEMTKKIKVLFIDPTDKDLGETLGSDVCLHLSRRGINANA
jgi:hypothetical protein